MAFFMLLELVGYELVCEVRPSDLDKTEQTAQDSAQDTAQDKAQDSAQDTAQEPQEPQLSKRQRQRLRQRQAREDAKRETTKATRAEEHAVSGANGVTRASRSSGHKAEQRLEALEAGGVPLSVVCVSACVRACVCVSHCLLFLFLLTVGCDPGGWLTSSREEAKAGHISSASG